MTGHFVISVMLSAVLLMLPGSACAAPAAPVTAAATFVTQNGFTANWGVAGAAGGYLFDVATDSNFISYVSGFNSLDVGNVTTLSVSGLNASATYYYRVRAYDAVGTSLNSNISVVLTLPATPSVPTANTATSVTQTGFIANWSASSGTTSYRLDVAIDAVFNSLVSGYGDKDVGAVTSSAVTGLTAGTTYYYRVRAGNSGGASVSSNTSVLVTLPAIPDTPVASGAISATQTGFSATWNTAVGATGYRLDVSINPAFTSFVVPYNNLDVANVTSSGVSGLTANTTYYYRVRAYNAGGTSASSATSAMVTLPLPPAAPLATAASAVTQSGFTANWGIVAAVGGYRVDVATDLAFTTFITGFNNRDVGSVTTVPVSGLASGTTYYYRVRAYNNGGAGINSNTIILSTVPVAPVASAAGSVTQTGFTATWGGASGATGYRIDVSADAAFATFVNSYSNKDVNNVTSSAVTGLTAGTTYYYRVRAYTTGGASGNSNIISLTTLATPLAAAATSVTQTGFTANWVPAVGAAGYRLDVASNATFTTFVSGFSNLDVATATNQAVTGLVAGTTYYYRVRSYNNSTPVATSANSMTVSQTTLATPVASAATAITLAGFTANWGVVSGASGFRLDVATDAAFTTFVAGYSDLDVSNVTAFAVSGLTSGVTYFYRVRCYNPTVTSVSSNMVSLTTVPLAPLASAASVISQTGLTANWGAVSGATGYKLDVATSNAFTTFVTGYSNKDVGNVTSFAVSTLTGGSTYYYRIRAYNNPLNPSPSSNIISQTTLAMPTANPAIEVTQTGFTASWNAAASASGYQLDVSTVAGFTTFVSGFNNLDVGNVTSYAVTGLTANTKYYYRLRAYNNSTPVATSTNSTTVSPTTLSTPVAIAATSITQTSFKANWNAAASASGYLLDVALDPGFTNMFTGYSAKDAGAVISFTVSGLTAGTTYYYRLRSYTNAGISTNSNTITLLMLPPTPAAPVATAAINGSQTGFTAAWGTVIGATGYKLDVSLDSAFTTFVTGYNNKDVTGGTSSSSAVSGLSASTVYYYRVRAYNIGGTSASSNVINPTTFPTAPVATAATQVTQTGFSATWNTVNGATGYRIDVASNLAFTTMVASFNNLDMANVTSFTVTGLSAGTTYYYRVRAYNIGGASGSSNVITQITVAPEPVAIAATSVTQTGFKATWNAAAGAGGYLLDVSADSAFTSMIIGFDNKNVLNVTSSTVSGLAADAVYYYRVRAFNAAGVSGNSNVITQATLATPVATAATFIAQASFTANWNAASGAASYKLDVSVSPIFATFVTGYSSKDVGNVTSSTISGLTAGVTYYYRVRAFSANVSSANSNVVSQATLATPLALPASAITQTGFSANWNVAISATGYQLDVATDAAFTVFVSGYTNKDAAGVTALAISGLLSDTTYYYRVRAYSSGGSSINSSSVTLKTLPATPATPVATQATLVTQYSFSANWGGVSGATGYRLDLASDPGFTIFVSGYSNKDMGNVTSSAISGLVGGTIYYYRVRAYNTGGTSASSGVVSLTTLPPTIPGVPTVAAASALTASGFSANWSIVSGADGYVLDVASDAAFAGMVASYANKDLGNASSAVVSGLTSGTVYYYRVRAYNAAGTSAVSATITVFTLPDAPLALAASNLSLSGFIASWSAVSGASGYQLDVSTAPTFSSFVAGYNSKDLGAVTGSAVGTLSAGTVYYLRVRAYNSAGSGASSAIVSQATLPVAPVAVVASSLSQSGFTLNWGTVSGATGYLLDVATDPGFTSFVIGYNNKDVGNSASTAVSGLAAGTTYFCRLRAYTGGGSGANSNTVIQATLPAAPPAPVATGALNIIPSGFTATWGAVFGVSGYMIDVASDVTFTNMVTGYNNFDVGDVLSLKVVGLTPGSAYFYRVRAYNSGGSGSASNSIGAGTASASLTVVDVGSGGGSVHSDSGGIACISGSSSTCSSSYDGGIQVTLTATPDASSVFSGWTGACSGTNPCRLFMDTGKTVTATFDVMPPVRIFDAVAPRYFASLQAAYDAAANGAIIQVHDGSLVGSLLAGAPVDVTIQGGFDANYAANSLDTKLQGTLIVRQGMVRLVKVKVAL